MPKVGLLQRKAVILIQNIEKHPELYACEVNHPYGSRIERQALWDEVARRAGYSKTQVAKSKWGSLVSYFRMHVDAVARKRERRYIPSTNNPEDRYVQLEDWCYYEYMKFMKPYLKKPRASGTSSAEAAQGLATGQIAVRRANAESPTAIESLSSDESKITIESPGSAQSLSSKGSAVAMVTGTRQISPGTGRFQAIATASTTTMFKIKTSMPATINPTAVQILPTKSSLLTPPVLQKLPVATITSELKLVENQSNVTITPISKLRPARATVQMPSSTTLLTPATTKDPLPLKLDNLILEIEVDGTKKRIHLNKTTLENGKITAAEKPRAGPVATHYQHKRVPQAFQELSKNDQNLKVFFNAMLCSTQKLSRFHQERIKLKLAKVLKTQKFN